MATARERERAAERERGGKRPGASLRRRRGRAAALALLLALAILGAVTALTSCGASAKPRLPAGSFRARLARVCATAHTQVGAIQPLRVPGDVPVLLRRAARVQTAQVKRLEALRPPAVLDARWRAQTRLLDRQLQIVKSLAAGVKDGQGDAVAAVAGRHGELASLRAAAARGWRSLGAPTCAG